jgi:RNA polymerase sigma-70 factor (ECF subfamily)
MDEPQALPAHQAALPVTPEESPCSRNNRTSCGHFVVTCRPEDGERVDDGDVDDDEQRFTAMYDRYSMRVWAYAASRAGSEAADEAVSETFMIAWRRFADMPSAELPWLLGVARNVMRDAVRAEVRRASLTAELRRWTEEPAADVAEGVIDRLAMLRALAELPDNDREVLTLMAWQGLSPREAARVLGCTAATVRVRLHRAHKRLAAVLQAPARGRGRHSVDSIGMRLS